LQNNEHIDKKSLKIDKNMVWWRIPRFGGFWWPKNLRRPLKSKVWSFGATYPKIKRVLLFSEIFP